MNNWDPSKYFQMIPADEETYPVRCTSELAHLAKFRGRPVKLNYKNYNSLTRKHHKLVEFEENHLNARCPIKLR